MNIQHIILKYLYNLPPNNHDDLSTFDGIEIYSNSPNALETWRIFMKRIYLLWHDLLFHIVQHY